ncbi:MAG: hypothetical protein ACREDR_02680, partial [Blastocatellia bacterium]
FRVEDACQAIVAAAAAELVAAASPPAAFPPAEFPPAALGPACPQVREAIVPDAVTNDKL